MVKTLSPADKAKMEKSANKWKFLCERTLSRMGRKTSWTIESLTKDFREFVEYYSKERAVYLTKSKGRKSKVGDEVQTERVSRVAPMTEMSFCVWMGKDRTWLRKECEGYEKRCEASTDPDDYDHKAYALLSGIRAFLNAQLLEGAVLGEYTPTLVSALLGIKDKIDVTSNGQTAAVPVINIVADNKTREEYKNEE